MLLKTYALAAGFAALFIALPAVADEVTVPAGRSTPIFQFGSLNDSCHAVGRPKPHVLDEPAHGKVEFLWRKGTLGKNSRHCAGKTTLTTLVIYTPNRGYHGKDHVRVGFSISKYDDDSGNSYYSSSADIVVR